MRKSFSFFTSTVYSASLLTFFLSACSASAAQATSKAPAIPSIIIPTPPVCTAIQVEPTPGSDAPSLFVPESSTDHVRGAERPLITITEYSDYQDLRSGLLAGVIDQLLEEHPKEVRVVSR